MGMTQPNDTQAPERIWAAPSPAFGWEDIVGGNYDAGMPGCVQYVRADLTDALIAERVREATDKALRDAVAICKKVRNDADSEDEAVGALDCAVAIMDEVNRRARASKEGR